ncbi:winged helix-turn-helix transcriptional regulator [Dyadobacter frigoris]|nr:winged helix-turn-helix transcriptional regulator [Dyadobacter frigoris]
MLSQELLDLEMNELLCYDTRPVTVVYELTPYGVSIKDIIESME